MKEYLKGRLAEYIGYQGRGNIPCPDRRNHKNGDNNPSAKIYEGNKLYCFGCGKSYDIFDIVELKEGITGFKAQYNYLTEYFRVPNNNPVVFRHNKEKPKKPPKKKKIEIDLTKYFLEAYRKCYMESHKYFSGIRKIDKKIVDKYRLLVYPAKKVLPSYLLPKITSVYQYDIILPIWSKGKVINAVVRKNPRYKNDNPRFLNLKGLGTDIFNVNKLDNGSNVLYVCESIIDALNIESDGFNAIALNSTSNKNKLVEIVREKNIRNKFFLLCGDNDKQGHDLNKFLKEELEKSGNVCDVFPLRKSNDINEVYVTGEL